MPWPDLREAMAEEYRAIGLGRRAGPEGEKLVSAVIDETERLLSVEERKLASEVSWAATSTGLLEISKPSIWK